MKGHEELYVDELEKSVAGLSTELAKAREIIDKLPKCWRLNDEGEVVQDVPVVPGMTMYLYSSGVGIYTHREPPKDYNYCWCDTPETAKAKFALNQVNQEKSGGER